jgi:hypothetical protein
MCLRTRPVRLQFRLQGTLSVTLFLHSPKLSYISTSSLILFGVSLMAENWLVRLSDDEVLRKLRAPRREVTREWINDRCTTLDILHYLMYTWYTRRFGSWLYSRFQVIGCHYTDAFLYIISNDSRDRTQDLSNTRLVRYPLDHRGGPKMVAVTTVLMLHIQFSCFVAEGSKWNYVYSWFSDGLYTSENEQCPT